MTVHAAVSSPMRHPLVRRLSALNLDSGHFAIFGSGPMLAHGLKTEIGDLDVIARGPAWNRAVNLGQHGLSKIRRDPFVSFWGGRIEIFQSWVTDSFPVEELIDTAEIFDGIRFVRLPHVLSYKRLLGRKKDAFDVAAIERYMNYSFEALV
ncbi:hypothetical protein [Streptomyces sp. NPDC008317]|uniref:hypothetical protein n=1 Tax=Streptomyces sp. NPDC008317 TaxID=3364827 RepID=UPI0036E95E8A